jgi:predicted DCC family thiol-disulfide oxidoreductase YuxK
VNVDDGQLALLYDADCGFCRWSLDKILAWDRAGRLRPVSLQDPEADRLLGDMPVDRKMASWHLVTPDGRVYSAGAAAAPLAAALPAGGPLAALARAFPGVTERAYQLAARNRDRLASWLGSEACAVDPAARRGTRRPDRAGRPSAADRPRP